MYKLLFINRSDLKPESQRTMLDEQVGPSDLNWEAYEEAQRSDRVWYSWGRGANERKELEIKQ